jgi:hypothetical protein
LNPQLDTLQTQLEAAVLREYRDAVAAAAREILDKMLDEIALYSEPVDPAGAIAAWHTVTPRTRNGGRVPKAPTLDEGDER